tara:strand:- start:80857 stop:81879 length:1023 start_codon:yes stop_codon:yes gene_type:complete
MSTPMKKKKNRSKLGRGLSALVDHTEPRSVEVLGVSETAGETNAPRLSEGKSLSEGGERVLELRTDQIGPNPHQPRRVFDEVALEELSQSIAEHGLMQPIVVRSAGEDMYELIAGERRWRATTKAGIPQIRAIVVDVDDAQSAQLALIENIQRADLNPIERAQGFVLLTDRFSMTQEQVSTKVGISRSSVANMLRLLELDEEIQLMIASNTLSAGHGKALLSCKDLEHRLALAHQVHDEHWSVRRLEEAVAEHTLYNMQQTPPLEGGGSAQEPEVAPSRMQLVLGDLEERLGEQLSTRVKLKTDKTGKRGSITLQFYDLDHFDGLMSKLGLGEIDDIGGI